MNVSKSQPRYLRPDQVEDIVQACAIFHPDYGLLIRFLVMTGLRVGEAAALNLEDVQTWNGIGTVAVTKTYDPRDGLSNAPKTSRSNREVQMPPSCVGPLEDYLAPHPRRADPSAPWWMGRRAGAHYMSDFEIVSWTTRPTALRNNWPLSTNTMDR